MNDPRPAGHLPAQRRSLAFARTLVAPLFLLIGLLALSGAPGSSATKASAQDDLALPFYHTGGSLGPILVADDQILVARGLRIVALSRDPASLGAELGQSEPLAGLPIALERHGERLLVATERKTLEVLDIATVGAPRLVQRIAVPEASAGLAIGGDRAYLIGDHRLTIVDLAVEPFRAQTISHGATGRHDGIMPVERRLAVVGDRLYFNSVYSLHVMELRPGPRTVQIADIRTERMLADIVAIGERVFALGHTDSSSYRRPLVIAVDARPGAAPKIVGRWIDAGDGVRRLCDLFAVDGHLGASGGEAFHVLAIDEPDGMRPVNTLATGVDCGYTGRGVSAGAGMVALIRHNVVGLIPLAEVVDPAAVTGTTVRHPDAAEAFQEAQFTWVRIAAPVGAIAVSGDTAVVAEGRRIRRLALDGAGNAHEVETLDVAQPVAALALGDGRLWVGDYDGLRVATLDGSPLALMPVALEGPVRVRVEALFAGGHMAYVATGDGRLHVVDASDMTAPRRVASLDLSHGSPLELLGHGTRLVTNSFGSYEVIDIADANQPVLLGAFQDRTGSGSAMATDGRTVWRNGDGGTVLAFDITDPGSGFPMSEQSLGFPVWALTWHEGVLFAAGRDGRVTAFDTSIRGRLREVGALTLPFEAEGIRVHGRTLVATHSRGGAVILPAPEIGPPTEPTAAPPTAVPTDPPVAPRYDLFLPHLHGADG